MTRMARDEINISDTHVDPVHDVTWRTRSAKHNMAALTPVFCDFRTLIFHKPDQKSTVKTAVFLSLNPPPPSTDRTSRVSSLAGSPLHTEPLIALGSRLMDFKFWVRGAPSRKLKVDMSVTIMTSNILFLPLLPPSLFHTFNWRGTFARRTCPTPFVQMTTAVIFPCPHRQPNFNWKAPGDSHQHYFRPNHLYQRNGQSPRNIPESDTVVVPPDGVWFLNRSVCLQTRSTVSRKCQRLWLLVERKSTRTMLSFHLIKFLFLVLIFNFNFPFCGMVFSTFMVTINLRVTFNSSCRYSPSSW